MERQRHFHARVRSSMGASIKKTVIVIGAGPAGLVTAKTLLEHSNPALEFDPIILEAEDDIGGTFQ